MARALPCQGRWREFESRLHRHVLWYTYQPEMRAKIGGDGFQGTYKNLMNLKRVPQVGL